MRLGRGARPFEILKLRTMTVDAEKHRSDGVVEAGDPRITRAGKLLRRTAVDELPQFLNVLRGDMSLVGPRPVPLAHLDRYAPREARRHEVRPGLTGWAQVHGRTALDWPERSSWTSGTSSTSRSGSTRASSPRPPGVLLRRDVAFTGEAGGWR